MKIIMKVSTSHHPFYVTLLPAASCASGHFISSCSPSPAHPAPLMLSSCNLMLSHLNPVESTIELRSIVCARAYLYLKYLLASSWTHGVRHPTAEASSLPSDDLSLFIHLYQCLLPTYQAGYSLREAGMTAIPIQVGDGSPRQSLSHSYIMIVLSIFGLEVRKVRMSFKSQGQIRILSRIVKTDM